MKKILGIATATIALCTLASVVPSLGGDTLPEEYLSYACSGGRQQFATTSKGRKERLEQSREEDPVEWVFVEASTRANGEVHMAIAHITKQGNVIDRSHQYIGSTQRVSDTYVWNGNLVRDRNVRMVGVLNTDSIGRRWYTESRYDGGHYAWSVTLLCSSLPIARSQ